MVAVTGSVRIGSSSVSSPIEAWENLVMVDERDDEIVLEMAKAIRPYLTNLVQGDAADVDRAIQELLSHADDRAGTASRILELVGRWRTTRDWAHIFVELGLPLDIWAPSIQERRDGYQRPSGDGSIVSFEKYVCPVDCNYVWYRRNQAQQPMCCPSHDLILVPIAQSDCDQ
jgi:hypothetical protein